jgi:hypothetical protein
MVAVIDEQSGASRREKTRWERRFPWSVRGYRRSAVDQHISDLECELREMDHELVELRAAATLREEVGIEMKRICEETVGVLIEAHAEREKIIRAANEEAARLVADATSRAAATASESAARMRELEAQLETVQHDRDRLLESALAASTAIADAVHTAHEQVPAASLAELIALEGMSDQGIVPQLSVHKGSGQAG